jgi:hypothetical protein
MPSAPKTSVALKSRAIQVVAFGLLHYLVLLILSGLIFFASHVPPKAANLDGAILGLFQVENVLTAPRKFLLWLVPGETTPGLLGLGTAVLNSLIWGVALASGRALWIKVRS